MKLRTTQLQQSAQLSERAPGMPKLKGCSIQQGMSGTNNEDTEAYKSILVVGFPLYKPYIQPM